MSATWTPSSWRARPAGQQPEWPDEGRLDDVLKRLAALPPLVFAGEARRLTAALGDVAQGRAFLLRSEEHTSELQSRQYLVCRLLLEKKKPQSNIKCRK